MKIKFFPMSKLAQNVSICPQPSSKFLPEWYKKTEIYVNNEKNARIHRSSAESANTTLKACMPFLDAMLSGYMVSLSSDVEIFKNEKNVLEIKWRTSHPLVESHPSQQTHSIPRTKNEYYEVLKWIFDWKIETPKGYSCLYTHPFNRSDLPFRTFSGIVDTDIFPDSVHFPFQLFELDKEFIIIEKGTPICQIFPFKRDEWNLEIKDFVPGMKKRATYAVLSKIQHSYKKQFWSKKIYN